LEESVVSGAITNRCAISRPQLNRKGDQTIIARTSNIPQAGGIESGVLAFGVTPWNEPFEAVWSSPSS
jgi:hypothetical protein